MWKPTCARFRFSIASHDCYSACRNATETTRRTDGAKALAAPPVPRSGPAPSGSDRCRRFHTTLEAALGQTAADRGVPQTIERISPISRRRSGFPRLGVARAPDCAEMADSCEGSRWARSSSRSGSANRQCRSGAMRQPHGWRELIRPPRFVTPISPNHCPHPISWILRKDSTMADAPAFKLQLDSNSDLQTVLAAWHAATAASPATRTKRCASEVATTYRRTGNQKPRIGTQKPPPTWPDGLAHRA